MPRTAADTKQKLIQAGEHLFARDGVSGALTRDIVARAGQANDSAVHYHFGSRQGLLAAILDKHIQRMEDIRRADLAHLGDNPRPTTIVRMIVEPLADELRTADGRDFLRIIAQLAGEARPGVEPAPLHGTALATQLRALDQMCRASLPKATAQDRIALMISMLTAVLADRARHLDNGIRQALSHEAYVANLVAMLTAALRARAA